MGEQFLHGFVWGMGFTLGAGVVAVVMFLALGMGLTVLGMLAGGAS